MPDDRDFTERQLTTRLVYDGRLLKVREDTVRLPDGKTARREYVEHPGAVMIVPLLDEKTLLMERQFRYAPQRHFFELPAGKIDAGETPLQTAQRELVEECGYRATEWHRLTALYSCIGYSNELIELYAARGLTHVGSALDDGEFLEVIAVGVDEALEWVRAGRITDIKTVVGLAWIRMFGCR
ncbi:MAG TPA: NUDIX hydrolase [Burkholderiales bacterium]|nr:NUDIX hydrolase [Burkholderiales bacterium]